MSSASQDNLKTFEVIYIRMVREKNKQTFSDKKLNQKDMTNIYFFFFFRRKFSNNQNIYIDN